MAKFEILDDRKKILIGAHKLFIYYDKGILKQAMFFRVALGYWI